MALLILVACLLAVYWQAYKQAKQDKENAMAMAETIKRNNKTKGK
jgi:hypothetical protein